MLPIVNNAATPTRMTSTPSSAWTGWGQWLALITMTVDHVTRYLLPDAWNAGWASSSLGRIAFPLFAAMVAWHALFNTRNPQRYARRVLIIGLIAQLPYMIMPRDAFQLNICFTLAMSLSWASWIRTHIEHQTTGTSTNPLATWMTSLTLVVSLVLWSWLGRWVEYGHAGLLLVPAFMLAMQGARYMVSPAGTWRQRMTPVVATLPVLAIAGWLNHSLMAKTFTLATTLIVLGLALGGAQRVPKVGLRMPRKLWLTWYPGHFAAIATWLLLADL